MSDKTISLADYQGAIPVDRMLQTALDETVDSTHKLKAVLILAYHDKGKLYTAVRVGGGMNIMETLGMLELGKDQIKDDGS